jgi:curved DNA-binding protein CbpA
VSLPDPYKVLQVDSEAEDEVIEAAYRRLARKYHPDVSAGAESQARMVQINQAWELLRDPASRAAVDRARARAAAATAQAAAADTHPRTAERPGAAPQRGPAPGTRSGDPTSGPARGERSQSPGYGSDQRRSPDWPFPGMRDPSFGEDPSKPPPDTVSRDWSSGRSTSGSGYDPSTMRHVEGEGSAGPPPGRPSGSVLNFGRYAGWSLGEIARTDLEYLEWLDRMPIGRVHQQEIDTLLRAAGRRRSAPAKDTDKRGLFRRR